MDFESGAAVAVCGYCDTRQTLPRIDDERKANLYDRASHFRRNNEYDKALAIYEQILEEDTTDAESYWSIILCRYGIEYVEDPSTHKRVPTVNRAQFTSVTSDEDYKKAIEYAGIEQKLIYEEEAKTIDEIQKGILEISRREDPFDIFICYKESDSDGRRTQDSVIAYDLYKELTNEGFKVFFSRVTLEDKLGTAYEPYIFAALHSARVMVVLGTKPEFFNAAWVKNEWSRYLALIKNREKKTLIPAYKGMDPYDLPDEFSHLQGQDMDKLGFMQDLIRGIKKIIGEYSVQSQAVQTAPISVETYDPKTAALLDRGRMALEDGAWSKAKGFFDQVLNKDSRCALAYLGLAMADYKVDFNNVLDMFKAMVGRPDDKNLSRAYQYGDASLRKQIESCCKQAIDLVEQDVQKYMEEERLAREKEERIAELKKLLEGLDNDPDIWTEESLARAKELEAAIEGKRQAMESAEAFFEQLKYRFDSRAGEYLQRRNELVDAVGTRKAELDQLAAQVAEKRAYCEGLGVFKRSEKEEVSAEIASLEKRIAELTRQIESDSKEISELNDLISRNEAECNDQPEKHDLDNARAAFENARADLEDYRRSVVEEKRAALAKELLTLTIGIGAEVQIGSWPVGEMAKPIDWMVLGEEDGKYLLISKEVIDKQKYNEEKCKITWEDCSLRKWLNGEFYEKAFKEGEKALIKGDSDGSAHDAVDTVFLLSIDEANKYFSTAKERIGKVSDYCRTLFESSDIYPEFGSVSWWLRSFDDFSSNPANVHSTGYVVETGSAVNNDKIGVRPAMWVRVEA